MSKYEVIDNLIRLKNDNNINRLGTIFCTNAKNYFYDTGTGKVVELDEDAYKIVKYFFYNESSEIDLQVLLKLFTTEMIETFDEDAKKNHLFQAIEPTKLYSANYYENFKRKVENELEQIILELTGKCNLRCKYCIYNDSYVFNRSFNSQDMTKEIVKKSIDYLYDHSKNSKQKAVTFYGGEPLIKFDLLKWAIEYARTIFKEDVVFSLTTNLTLITEEIAHYLGTVPNLTIVASLDGPKEVHDKCRVYADGRETFDDAIKGLKLLSKEMKKSPTTSLMINAVYTPPYSMEGIRNIMNFFESLDFLPKNLGIQVTYPTDGSYKYDDKNIIKNEKDRNPLWEWIKEATNEKSLTSEKNAKYASSMFNALTRIHNRFLVDEPVDYYPFHSCCIPGVRRLYIDTKGDFYICEKIGDSPKIGNINEGIDMDNIRKHFIDGYSENMIPSCKKCWAIRLCHSCYVDRFTKDGFRKNFNYNSCSNEREAVKNELILYHSILEQHPEKIEEISKIKYY